MGFPLNNHETSLIHGLALIWHSKNTSEPSWIELPFRFVPKVMLSCGASKIQLKINSVLNFLIVI